MNTEATTPEQVALYRLFAIKSALRLEMTGMKGRTSATKAAREELTKAGKKAPYERAGLMVALKAHINSLRPELKHEVGESYMTMPPKDMSKDSVYISTIVRILSFEQGGTHAKVIINSPADAMQEIPFIMPLDRLCGY